MNKTHFFKWSLLGIVAALALNINTVSAQRYRDRGQQNQAAEERKANDNPDSLENKSFVDRLVYGANFNLEIGNPTFVDISPLIGYRLTPQWQAGVGATFIYYYDQEYYGYTNTPGTYTVTNQGEMYGGRIYSEYDVFGSVFRPNDKVFVHAESEMLNISYFYQDPQTSLIGVARAWITDDYVGIGYREPFGKKGYFNASFLYNLNYQAVANISPFGPLSVRVGFTF